MPISRQSCALLKQPRAFRLFRLILGGVAASLAGNAAVAADTSLKPRSFSGLREINPPQAAPEGSLVAILGAMLVDGRGGDPVADSAVLVRGDTIVAAGSRASVGVPSGATIVSATGLTLLPGLIDAHMHLGSGPAMYQIPKLYIAHGVTTARDPGRPNEVYAPIRASQSPMPRCFVTGPHFDGAPPAWPHNAIVIASPDAARAAVRKFVGEGASAIKVYFRLSLDSIRATCETAHELKVPVTAHLELSDPVEAIEAGLDGIEHITSFGVALAEPAAAARFRASVDADNEARHDERYRLWADLDLERSPRVKPFIALLARRGIIVSPTLTTFERRTGDAKTQAFHVRGFANMMKFTGLCQAGGVVVVVGSHTWGKHTEVGWAFQREMELLVESGLSPRQAIQAATLENARFLGCADRLGTIEKGKLADLVLVAGNPLSDIRAMYNVKRVMLNGRWIEE